MVPRRDRAQRDGVEARENTLHMVRNLRITLMSITAFIALMAVGGGIALATGLEDSRFPREMLAGTPFNSYVLPGVLLAVLVGGSAAVATIMLWRRARYGAAASVIAGGIMMGWIIGEILLLEQPTEPTGIELIFFALGLALAGLGLMLQRTGE